VQQSGTVKVNSDYIASNSSEIAPESTNQVQEQQDIVTFSDDKAVLPEAMPLEKPLSGPENAQHTDWAQHSIVTFMQRPQLLGEYNWVKTVQRGYIVDGLDFNIPSKLLTPMLLNKLDGFTSFRATAVIKLQVNSQPFQQGRMILAAIPMPELISPRDEYLTKHPTYLQAINHIQVDISKQTEISLRIPFVSPFNSFDLISNQYQWARVVAVVYSQLRDPRDGGGNVPIRVWGHFEDIQLGTPTSGVFNSQPTPAYVAKQQAGKLVEPSAAVAKAAQSKESLGIVSALGGGVQSIYNTIGENVPFLKPVTNILSSLSNFGTNAVGSVLGFFGLCKPQVGYSGASVLVRPCEYYGNANGIDHSHVLALDRMNNVDQYPGLGGTACDEMSFDFLKKIPQFVDYFKYSTTSKSTDVLFDSWVTPTYFAPGYLRIITPPTDSGDAKTECKNIQTELKELQPTVLNYISSSFMYWTGSLVYTFRFVKTDFHSGRVEISFHPFTNYVDANKSRLDYTYRLVVDLRENTEVSVSIPYVSPQPWKTVRAKNPMTPVPVNGWADYGPCSTGKLIVKPITPLVLSAAVVETEIECVVEVRAGDDFQVQGPCRAGYFPFSVEKGKRKSQSLRERRLSLRDRQHGRARQQSGPFAVAGTSETRSAAVEGLIPDSITHGMLDIHRVDTRMLCSGEVFENFRQLIKRFNFVEKLSNFKLKSEVISRSAPYYLRSPNLTFAKFYHNGAEPPVVTASGKFNQFKFSMNITPMSFVSAMYAFYRGGMRFKVYTSDKDVTLVSGRLVDVTDVPNLDALVPGFTSSTRRFASIMSPTAYELIQQKGFAEFQIPFYSPVYICIPWDKSRISTFDQSSALIDISFSSDAQKDEIPVYLSVAAADDMTFHGFIGIPPVISAGRINTTHGMRETQNPGTIAPESIASYIDTTAMAVDPAYPITWNTAKGKFWQGSTTEAEQIIYIDDLMACPSKVILDVCDAPPGKGCDPPYDDRCWDRPPASRPPSVPCTTTKPSNDHVNTPTYTASQIREQSHWGKLNGLLH